MSKFIIMKMRKEIIFPNQSYGFQIEIGIKANYQTKKI